MDERMKALALNLDTLSDDVLLERVEELVGRGRRVEAELVRHLAEVDRRRLHLREACPSMHVYATARLHLSDAEAYLRITVARLSRRFPVVLDMLADGRLHLSAIARLAPHLREDNVEMLLGRAAHRSKREIELLVAELAPQPDVPSRMRRLPGAPVRRVTVGAGQLVPAGVSSRELSSLPAPPDASVVRNEHATTAEPAGPMVPAAHVPAMEPSTALIPSGSARRSDVMAPIAPSRYRVQFTASADLHGKIERARALLRHQIPDGDLGAVFDRAMTLLVRELERARFAGTKAPRKAAEEADPTPSSRRIPDPIKRAVWIRDEERCTFRDRKGRRCPARERLEFHHLTPFGLGGDHSPSNVALRCAAHNALQADLDFGAAFMAGKRNATRASERRATYGAGCPARPMSPAGAENGHRIAAAGAGFDGKSYRGRLARRAAPRSHSPVKRRRVASASAARAGPMVGAGISSGPGGRNQSSGSGARESAARCRARSASNSYSATPSRQIGTRSGVPGIPPASRSSTMSLAAVPERKICLRPGRVGLPGLYLARTTPS
jgi:hypothetical protein